MPRPVLEAALRAFPDTAFTNAYGLTETSSTIAVLGPDDHRAALGSGDPQASARLASAPKPLGYSPAGRSLTGCGSLTRGVSRSDTSTVNHRGALLVTTNRNVEGGSTAAVWVHAGRVAAEDHRQPILR